MLLVLTNSRDATADYLVPLLLRRGIQVVRFDTDSLLDACSFAFRPETLTIVFHGQKYVPESFSNIWYRRPERLACARLDNSPEGRYAIDECSEILEGFLSQIPQNRWMNHPAANARAANKLEQLSAAAAIGLKVPRFIVTQDAGELRQFFELCHQRVVVKPLASGYIERQANQADSLLYANLVSPNELADLSDLAKCPTFFQEYIEKTADVRITFVDGRFHAVELQAREADGAQRCDIRRNNMDDVHYRALDVPPEVSARLRQLIDNYRLRFAAIDMVVALDGTWYFLEVNPNGQWAWLDLTGSVNIAESFVEAFGPGAF